MEAGPCSPFMNRLCVILLSLHSIKCTTEDQGSFWQLQATYCRLESIFTLCNLEDCAMHVCTLMYVALLFLHEGTTDARWCANQNWCAIDIFWYFRVSLYLWGPFTAAINAPTSLISNTSAAFCKYFGVQWHQYHAP